MKGFYDWYLGYIGDRSSGEMRNPLVDGAYKSSEYLTENFIQKVDEIIASFDKGGYDPFLCVQDIPASFNVGEATISGDEATAILHEIWNAGMEYESVYDVTVMLRKVDGEWKIDNVACNSATEDTDDEASAPSPQPEGDLAEEDEGKEAQLANWQVFRDDAYGFQIQYPADWAVQEARIGDAEGDLPIKRVLGFSPQDLGGRVTPVSIEVGIGGLEEMGMWPVSTADQNSATTINGYTVLVGEGMHGHVFYVFEHPTNGELQVAVRDQTGSANGSELKDVVNGMLSSFRFREQ